MASSITRARLARFAPGWRRCNGLPLSDRPGQRVSRSWALGERGTRVAVPGSWVGGYSSGLPCAVMIHHTASGPSSDGQPDVNYMCYSADARPIANIYLARTGIVWVMAAGATNTNGSGGPLGPVSGDSMNSSAIGIEAGNNGTGEPWPEAQQRAYTQLCSALCKHYGIPVGQVWSHCEWAPGRKIDPAGPSKWAASGTWNEDSFRGDVALYSPGPTPPPTPTPVPPTPTPVPRPVAGSARPSLARATTGAARAHV